MNCQENDLAMVTRRLSLISRLMVHPHHLEIMDAMIGRTVCTVQNLVVRVDLGPCWLLKDVVHSPICGCGFIGLPDEILTPLREPEDEDDVFTNEPINGDVRAPSRVTQ